jgi:hypothetical protein
LTDQKGKKPVEIKRSDGDGKKERTEHKNWEPPPEGWLKANVDGSFIADKNEGTTGVVIRDNMGRTIVAGGNILKSCSSAEEVEVLGGVCLDLCWLFTKKKAGQSKQRGCFGCGLFQS